MGIELICDVCQAPMCAFAHRYDGTRICVHCRSIERVGSPDLKVYRALGVLTASARGYILSRRNRFADKGRRSAIFVKANALIKHDQILRGDA